MYYNKVHGSCTSTAVYMATILRALGIPTRMIVSIPPFDPNDDTQAQAFYNNIHHHRTREMVRAALNGVSGFVDHILNEVYVGNSWVRLNYDRLGQPVLDSSYLGLQTHIYTFSDLSQVPVAQTWGTRWFKYPAVNQPKLTSINPYRMISVKDDFGPKANLENPRFAVAELRTVTITDACPPKSPKLPIWVKDQVDINNTAVDFFIVCKEWQHGQLHNQMRAFYNRAGHVFQLFAVEYPTIKVRLTGLTISAGDGSFQAYGAKFCNDDRAKLSHEAEYVLRPINTSDTYRWEVSQSIPPVSFNVTGDSVIETEMSRLHNSIENLRKRDDEQSEELRELRRIIEELRVSKDDRDKEASAIHR